MINSFTKEYRFLSNFYPCRVELDGDTYPSVEHAYQAAKTLSKNLRMPFMESAMKANEAKSLGKKLKPREDWNNVKLSIMEKLVRDKFNTPKFSNMLLSTGDNELIEGNWWGDVFWGMCKGKGENHLGKILMKIRSELKEEK